MLHAWFMLALKTSAWTACLQCHACIILDPFIQCAVGKLKQFLFQWLQSVNYITVISLKQSL